MKKIKTKTVLATIVLSALTASGYAEKATPIIDKAKMSREAFANATAASENTTLGRGYLANAMIPLQMRCLRDMDVQFQNIQSNISLNRATHLDKIAENLGVNLNAKAGWGKFSAKASVNYIRDIKEDDYSLSFTFQNIISGYAELDTRNSYGEDALSTAGLAALRKSEDDFIARCGDQYIRGIDMGAVLSATIRIRFRDQNQKKQFEAKISGKIGDIFKASGKINDILDPSSFDGSVELMAFQVGGQPHYLSQIFGVDSEHAIIHCNADQLELCGKAMDNILDYSQANGAWKETGFINQLKIVDGKLIADNLAVIGTKSINTGSYKDDFGLDVSLKPTTPAIQEARVEMNHLYDEQDSLLTLAHAVLNSRSFQRLNIAVQDKLKKMSRNIENNIELFNSEKAMDCFFPSSQNKCPQIVSKIKSQIINSDNQLLSLLQEAYYININHVWPLILVKNSSGNYDFYNLNMELSSTYSTQNVTVTPSSDFSFIALGGSYSYVVNGIMEKNYLNWYGSENLLYMKDPLSGYGGTVPWYFCRGNTCFKTYVHVELLPF